jgi:nicotinamidase/pyrazinamidase
MARRALLVVDVQHDFLPGGALGVPDGDAVLGPIALELESGAYDVVLATRDWHPLDHGSFVTADPPGPWPVHCVQGTPGAGLSEALDRTRIDEVVDKGQDPGTEGYSGFDGTDLATRLREGDVEEVTVVGLATDWCVKHTALEALREGFRVHVLAEATRPVEREPGDGQRALDEVRAAGGVVD